MESVIKWIDYSKEKPLIASKWVMAVLKPVNYMEFIDNPSEMNDWISKFGINKVWIHNGSFWLNHKDISDRVTHWAEIDYLDKFNDDKISYVELLECKPIKAYRK